MFRLLFRLIGLATAVLSLVFAVFMFTRFLGLVDSVNNGTVVEYLDMNKKQLFGVVEKIGIEIPEDMNLDQETIDKLKSLFSDYTNDKSVDTLSEKEGSALTNEIEKLFSN